MITSARGQELRHREGDVTGAGRHVDDEEVGFGPVDVGEELLERLVQHRAAPDDGLVLAREEAHRDEPHSVGRGRHDHVVDECGRVLDAEHPGHREAPHVGVDRGDAVTALRERDREVGRDRRLAHTPLARRDRQHPCARVDERVRTGPGRLAVRRGGVDDPERIGRRLALQHAGDGRELVLTHRPYVDLDAFHSLDRAGRGPDPVHQLVADGLVRDRQGEGDDHGGAVGGDPLDHPQLDDRAAQLGVVDGPQGLTGGLPDGLWVGGSGWRHGSSGAGA